MYEAQCISSIIATETVRFYYLHGVHHSSGGGSRIRTVISSWFGCI